MTGLLPMDNENEHFSFLRKLVPLQEGTGKGTGIQN